MLKVGVGLAVVMVVATAVVTVVATAVVTAVVTVVVTGEELVRALKRALGDRTWTRICIIYI